MTMRARRFDAANYLDTPEARLAYLRMAFADNDAVEIVEALAAVSRALGVATVARKHGTRRDALMRTLGSEGNPDVATLLRVIEALGLTLSVDYAG